MNSTNDKTGLSELDLNFMFGVNLLFGTDEEIGKDLSTGTC